MVAVIEMLPNTKDGAAQAVVHTLIYSEYRIVMPIGPYPFFFKANLS